MNPVLQLLKSSSVSATENGGKLVVNEVRREEASVVADIVWRLIGAYPVSDTAEKQFRPACAGDIALVAPTGTSLWIYERALERLGIPIATQAGKGFFRRQEVQDMIAIARAIADHRRYARIRCLDPRAAGRTHRRTDRR